MDDSIVGAKVPIKTSQMWPRRPYKGKRNLAEEEKKCVGGLGLNYVFKIICIYKIYTYKL